MKFDQNGDGEIQKSEVQTFIKDLVDTKIYFPEGLDKVLVIDPDTGKVVEEPVIRA